MNNENKNLKKKKKYMKKFQNNVFFSRHTKLISLKYILQSYIVKDKLESKNKLYEEDNFWGSDPDTDIAETGSDWFCRGSDHKI